MALGLEMNAELSSVIGSLVGFRADCLTTFFFSLEWFV